jgi:hypothetical protein
MGGMERLGYVPLSKALQKCEGRTGYRVRTELDRYRTLLLQDMAVTVLLRLYLTILVFF